MRFLPLITLLPMFFLADPYTGTNKNYASSGNTIPPKELYSSGEKKTSSIPVIQVHTYDTARDISKKFFSAELTAVNAGYGKAEEEYVMPFAQELSLSVLNFFLSQ